MCDKKNCHLSVAVTWYLNGMSWKYECNLVYLLCAQSPDIILFICLLFKKALSIRIRNVISTLINIESCSRLTLGFCLLGVKRGCTSEGLSLVSVCGEKTINGGSIFKIEERGNRFEGSGRNSKLRCYLGETFPERTDSSESLSLKRTFKRKFTGKKWKCKSKLPLCTQTKTCHSYSLSFNYCYLSWPSESSSEALATDIP